MTLGVPGGGAATGQIMSVYMLEIRLRTAHFPILMLISPPAGQKKSRHVAK